MDYKSTVFLPNTSFSMKGALPDKEQEIFGRWEKDGLYQKIRAKFKGRPKFILHDGPPFANGSPHAGTALNRILKDAVIKFKQMQGYDAPFVPGWDCHGLPIEWKVAEQLKDKKQDKPDTIQFRKMCRDFASYWIDVQKSIFKRLGSLGDWENPYLTMDPKNEAIMVREFGKLLMSGAIYRGERPVLWSVIEKTALAEAELEYKDKKSASIYVAFKIKKTPSSDLLDASCVIWTTTPWTLPGNRAISFSDKIKYLLISVNGCLEDRNLNTKLIIAEELKDRFLKDIEASDHTVIRQVSSDELKQVVCQHPLAGVGYNFDVALIDGKHVTSDPGRGSGQMEPSDEGPNDFYDQHPWAGMGYDFDILLLEGRHVTADSGTGLVHTAPGHGLDDFYVCKKYGVPVVQTVDDGGCYYDCVPIFAGKHIFKVEQDILDQLRKRPGTLLAAKEILHSYPHSWRSKAPLIYRTTKQWFISLDKTDLRKKALKAIEDVRWLPSQGYNRIKSFVSSRGDWCISRQRTWGVPLTMFIDKKTGDILKDQSVIDRTASIIEKEGTDAWYSHPAQDFLGDKYKASDFEQVFDIVDVWLESGSTHAYVLKNREELAWPADLYLEGSDQHRGWFQASLLHACATYDSAPYKSVLTHGFVVDEQGYKMSKSLGNVIDPMDIVSKNGADIMRLWAVNNEYTEDMKFGPTILKQQEDIYRRIRNTLRYMLGALDQFDDGQFDYDLLTELDKWTLHKVAYLDNFIREQVETFALNRIVTEIHNFCSADLSAFYFDVRKDCLYCDDADDPKRKAYRQTLSVLFDIVVKWLAPIVSFTAEEAWLTRRPEADSIHMQNMPVVPAQWYSPEREAKWRLIKAFRTTATAGLERARENKVIGSSLQASIVLYDPEAIISGLGLSAKDWAELFITSSVDIKNSNPPADACVVDEAISCGIEVVPANGEKCQRCWKVLPEVEQNPEEVCDRCAAIIRV
ncbi:MAG: isoleucine--tRNA ligase [Holosporales bacterium]|jgi:isoleucyl-tRNA synthetase|nr:isoleucine--tRNA ligase [Holosporales bacterium]